MGLNIYWITTTAFFIQSVFFTYFLYQYNISFTSVITPEKRVQNNCINISTNDLIYLAKDIREAKIHVRGTKTGNALIRAEKRMVGLLSKLNLDFQNETKRIVRSSDNICPEIFKGTHYGSYFYDKGFEVKKCSYSKSLTDLVTILLFYNKHQTFSNHNLLQSIKNNYKNISVIFGYFGPFNGSLSKEYNNIKFINFSGEEFEGRAWNNMLKYVSTPYTLIARDVMRFHWDARLGRLVRQIERFNVTSAGGAYRDINGHWMLGCQQRVFRNFTLVYEVGYDESVEECLFCDHIDGPFISKTRTLQEIQFNEHITSQGLFEELFYRLSGTEHVVCPDAMFYTNKSERSYDARDWESFQSQWTVYKIKFSGREIVIPMSSYDCYTSSGTSLTPWCQQELADILYATMKVCEEVNVICEVNSGTVMGVVKFHAVLPWEYDADISFLSDNFTILENATTRWKNMNYTLKIGTNILECCFNGRKYGGILLLHSRNWRMEILGMAVLQSERKYIGNITPTLCNMDGHWLRGPRNPGLYVRNKYGNEIYQHAQHWRHTGTGSSTASYIPNRFVACGTPGAQNCLDRYNGDGNLQFRDPIP